MKENIYINGVLKCCGTCQNNSCRVEQVDKVGYDEEGYLKGSKCFGYTNTKVPNSLKLVRKK